MIVPRIFFPALMQSFCIGSAVLSSLVVGVEFPEQHDMNSLQVGLCLVRRISYASHFNCVERLCIGVCESEEWIAVVDSGSG